MAQLAEMKGASYAISEKAQPIGIREEGRRVLGESG
jgi:hypothetical protein